MRRRPDRATSLGLGIALCSAVVYWLANRGFDAGRGDFFYLADAFLHGRTWLDFRPGSAGSNDVIVAGSRFYVPFAPFPAVGLMPLVAIMGAVPADQAESAINAVLAGSSIGLCWWLLGRVGVHPLLDRSWLTILFGFSTQILWVTTRGGVWHTGHLVATILTFACLLELWGSRRAWLIGLLAGAAFMTRAPLAFAIAGYALLLAPEGTLAVRRTAADALGSLRMLPWWTWITLGLGVLPAFISFFAYNQVRFGTPFESGYALATLPLWLEAQRERGMFSVAHLPMNLDYFLVHLPSVIAEPPFLKPDGLGMSVLLTSPGLLFAIRADWRRRDVQLLGLTAVLVLIPTLLYYGGGWLQYGYRYFLDSVPFVLTLCGLAASHRGRVGLGWRAMIAFGTGIMALGVYWAYNL
ncbi:MAG: hypothetical protein ACSLFN_03660 [Candidatus Limnocylindrales bacterium]